MTSVERMYATYQAARYVAQRRLDGAYVECGVWRGGSSMMAALALRAGGDVGRELYLYDTFEGMPEPGLEDEPDLASLTNTRAEWERNQTDDVNLWCFGALDEVGRNMATAGVDGARLKLVKGKVEETIPDVVPERIAMLRLDTDWYASTKHELVHLFPRLVPGGVLILDDYGHWPGHRQAVDEYFAETGCEMLLSRVDYAGRIGVKPG